MTSQQTGGLKPTRRTLVKGAAWSVPVVAVGSSAPAFAASPPPDECLDIVPGGEACKDPGASGNAFGFNLQYCFRNTCETGTLTVTVTRLRSANYSYDITLDPPEILEIPAGEQRCTNVYRVNGSNSGNFQAVHYIVGGVEYIDDRVDAPPRDCLPEELEGASAPVETDASEEQITVDESVVEAQDEVVVPEGEATAKDTADTAVDTPTVDPAATTVEPQNG